MATPEVLVKKEITKALQSLQATNVNLWWFMPIGGRFALSGVPDYVGLCNGRFWAIEAKAKGGVTTKLQDKIINLIRTAGGTAVVIKPKPDQTITEQVNHAISQLSNH